MQKFNKKTAGAFAISALLLGGFAIAPGLIDAKANQPVNPPCQPFAATFVFTLFQFTSATTAIGQGIVFDGDNPVGSFAANYFNIDQKSQGVIQMNAQHTLTFDDGSTLMTHDDILLEPVKTNPGWLRANSRLHVVDGTGAYAGATGLLHTHGEVNVSTVPPQGSIDFDGQVCLP